MLADWLDDFVLAGAITAAVLVPFAIYVMRSALSGVNAMYRALAGTVNSYRDGALIIEPVPTEA
jgi:two-component system, NtrC family, nitrogen regulation sensor histidine kinase NtrY